MKTATLPALRVDPGLRESVEQVLQDGETLSSFVEAAVRNSVHQRQVDAAFLSRGLKAREDAKAASEYYDAGYVLGELDQMLALAKETQSR